RDPGPAELYSAGLFRLYSVGLPDGSGMSVEWRTCSGDQAPRPKWRGTDTESNLNIPPRRNRMSYLGMKQLLEAGVHFGHETKRANPKMKRYIFAERNGIFIIDLQK